MENLTRANAVEDKSFLGDLDKCIDYLIKCRQEGKSIWIEFNGHKLYSCDATVNNVYVQMYGKTKAEVDREMQEEIDEYHKSREERKDRIKENMPEWIEAGSQFIYPERLDEWKRCVERRSNDLYLGSDLEFAITAMQMLENGAKFENVKNYLSGLDTSGGSHSKVESVILNFSKRGPEFYEFLRGGHENIDENTQGMISKLKDQNSQYKANEVLREHEEEWSERAAAFIYPEKTDEWKKCIQLSAKETFRGTEVEMALGAMELLNKGVEFSQVEKYLEDKSTSATQAAIAETIVLNFSKRGPEFFSSIRPGEKIDLVEQISRQNASLEEKHRNDQIENVGTSEKTSPIDELKSLAAEKKSLEKTLQSLESEISEKTQLDKNEGQGIGE